MKGDQNRCAGLLCTLMTHTPSKMQGSSPYNRMIVWLAWGESHIREASQSCETFKRMGYPTCLITDESTKSVAGTQLFDIVQAVSLPTDRPGLLVKCSLWEWLPDDYDSFLFADTDTRMLEEVHFGFEKAEQYGIAVTPSVHYSVDAFFSFGEVMLQAGVAPKGQLQYNSGLIFFTRTPEVQSVFARWNRLARDHDTFTNDQPFLTLAMEMEDFNPYVLSSAYNYRGLGMPLSGKIRIWHSRRDVPEDLNDYPSDWPLRYVIHGKVRRHPPDPDHPRQRLMRILDALHLRRPARKIKRKIIRLIGRNAETG